MTTSTTLKINEILERARVAAIDYYQLTGKPLGITGEIGEYLAAKHLNLDLAVARTAGHDATDKSGKRIQIKARSILSTKRLAGQLGTINLNHKWDVVVAVIMDEFFDPIVMYEAERRDIEDALMRPGSKARNKRGSLSISKFRSIGKEVWKRTR